MQANRRLDLEGHAGRKFPRFTGGEGANLLLALHHDAGGHALHAACAQSASDLLPEDGGDLVAHDAIDDAASLLSIDAIHVDGTRRLERALHFALGDRVEGHALGLGRLHAEHLGEVPGDRFALAVQVGREPDFVGALGQPTQLRHGARLVVVDLVGGGEVVVQIDSGDGLLLALG